MKELGDDPFVYKKFPDNFLWGTATAAYQIEGAWNVSGQCPSLTPTLCPARSVRFSSHRVQTLWHYVTAGKGENIWDYFTHNGYRTHNNENGDVACLSYYKYKEDIQLMKEMGVSLVYSLDESVE